MPIDPLTEHVLPLKDLGRKLPGKPQYTTVVAWCQQGRVNWYTHQRVKMEMLYLPGGRAAVLKPTSASWPPSMRAREGLDLVT